MIKKKNKHFSGTVYWAFIYCFMLIITVFIWRVVHGSEVTPFSDGQTIMSSRDYSTGSVYDRSGVMILKGNGDGVSWRNSNAEIAFENVMGIDITETLNSRTTVLGNCPFVFGTEDNRFTMYELTHPFSEKVGGSVQLTFDTNLQEYIYSVICDWGFENTDVYVMVSDYTSGEILAAYGNVFTEAMHPGSTIKPILTATALTVNPKVEELIYECTDENHVFHTKEGDVRINCHNGITHGTMTLRDGIAYSCNGYFIHLMQCINKKGLLNELKEWGFDTSVSYSQFMYWDQRFSGGSENDLDHLLASIGQANCYTTPAGLHFCISALLNHGVQEEPTWLLAKQATQDGEWTDLSIHKEKEICSSEVADKVIDMMLGVTERGTGTAFYLDGFAAKTGTAQISDGSEKNTVWTSGGLTNSATPYSITVCINNVEPETKSSVAGMIAQNILLYMTGGM